ncbi:MAG: hypothetical protein EPN98_14025 [Phenylobacterium sp.]|uniref:hypothetical protein n=1 Tax=Phenylobacterium sp. TaxID=1871053 RepID=UPI00121FD2DB|nr:hypothetical protein [Phenylobacterium sp.]TAL32264.1 MAG: hypothetical protein EPN98_14025 [Phenylobacterium sp.]
MHKPQWKHLWSCAIISILGLTPTSVLAQRQFYASDAYGSISSYVLGEIVDDTVVDATEISNSYRITTYSVTSLSAIDYRNTLVTDEFGQLTIRSDRQGFVVKSDHIHIDTSPEKDFLVEGFMSLRLNPDDEFVRLPISRTSDSFVEFLVSDYFSVNIDREDPTRIYAEYNSPYGRRVIDIAKLGGYTGFNWLQVIDNLPCPSPFRGNRSPDTMVCTNGIDPIKDPYPGGWTYDTPVYDPYPRYYYQDFVNNQSQGPSIFFEDRPSNPCLFGSIHQDIIDSKCGGQTAAAGEYMEFTTKFVGVKPNGHYDTFSEFRWASNYNGTVGGGAWQLRGLLEADPGSGTGGAFLLDTSAVPEPLAWVTAVSGFGAVGLFLRRARQRRFSVYFALTTKTRRKGNF